MSHVVAIKDQVEAAVQAALSQALPAELADADPVVRRSDRADFQSNGPLAVAKRAGRAPRDLASATAAHLAAPTTIGGAAPAGSITPEVSGPGFLNLTVPAATIWQQVAARLTAENLGVATSRTGERTVIDYSAPNVAKEMHVGHLRSTIIGDTLARVLAHLGAEVTRQNHVGDWGTQFGMLIQFIDEHPERTWQGEGSMSALDALYRAARAEFNSDPGFADRSRERVVALQSGDAATLATWRELVAESETAFQAVYDRLGILLAPADADGESRYNADLPGIVDELTAQGIAVDSGGALCAFTDGVVGPDGDPVPLIVRKKDGGFGYAATDLATLRLRVDEYRATRILYVVDARQALHFRMVFDVARRAGWLPDDVAATHVPFGTVLGADGKPFKTRDGGTVRLNDLLDQAVERARAELAQKDHGLTSEEFEHVAQSAGIGAVKYADLSNTRTKDYVFDVDRMVALNGNTGVYLQYAHARVRSILRKAADAGVTLGVPVDPALALHPAERALALTLDELAATLDDVAETLEPHRLAGYLFGLARAYTEFYDQCPVLRADDDGVRANRLALCDLTGRTLATGLDLLGLAAPDRM
ncbi:arginine--tRNA ligase [Promicromonospora sukumoe]|uniref:Arginine--tRNA ligase n=1 Tax=Promicromonospora sukumoe TaxID=88382 RepID=A0A7W3PD54_9MICO|nr:arginine--tRNA ligase [Promicromonospora sukumoe]MBA8807371.1 arginyl-tRNA synthetase [Promicromonospora sukumoe]